MSGPIDPIKNLEWRQKLSQSRTGKAMTEEVKAKIRQTIKEYNTQHPENKHDHFLGRKHSIETRQKMSIAVLGEKNHNWKGNNPKHAMDTGHLRAERWFPKVSGKEKHHIDGNPLNNNPTNILYVTRKEHMELDGRLNNLRRNRNGGA